MVKYTRGYTPLCLVDKKVQKAFAKDIDKKDYVDTLSRYKCKYQKDGVKYYPIADALKKIYRNKCAYCETQFHRTFIKIEHYRPKSIYYSLAYSWSNLLPICDKCNTKKSNKFEIEGLKVVYLNESLFDIQYKAKEYNLQEKPKFIHPEIDDYKDMFRFNTNGKIIVYKSVLNSHRMAYTIDNSDLNEDTLMEKRAKVLQDFIKIRDELFYLFFLAKKHKDKEELDEFKKRTNEKIKIFFNDENEFIAVRQYIIKRLRFFLFHYDDKFVKFFNGYLEQYIKNIAVYNNTLAIFSTNFSKPEI